jgi:hypothetical protein
MRPESTATCRDAFRPLVPKAPITKDNPDLLFLKQFACLGRFNNLGNLHAFSAR